MEYYWIEKRHKVTTNLSPLEALVRSQEPFNKKEKRN